jgi:multidrug efflux pump subunit AcrA (membrane-fusion protein)
VPYEFEANEHFFKDASGQDVEPAAEETVGGHGHAHGEGGAHAEHGEESDAIELPASAHKLLGMTFATAVRRPVAGTARFPGRFEWMPGAARVYGAALGGKVEVKVKASQRVKAGEVLFTVRSPEWVRQRGEGREAEASLALARAEASAIRSRLAQLREAGTRHAELEMALAVKEAEVVRAERTSESVEERRQAVLGLCREQGGELFFEAVEEGVVESLGAISGAWLEAGAEVVRTVRPEMVWFRADGLMVDLARVRDGMRGFVEPFQGGGLSVDVRAEGRVELGLSAEVGRRVRPLYLRPERVADWMVQGRAGVLSAVVEESVADAVAVPLGSVVTDGLQSVVFVRDAANKNLFHRREVVPGVGDGDWVEVKGVSAGDEVVLNGSYELKLATPSAAGGNKAAGHFHADGNFHEAKH